MKSRLRHWRHRRFVARGQLQFGQEVRSRVDVDVAFGVRGVEQAQRGRNVRPFHVPVAGADVDDAVPLVAELVDRYPLVVGQAGHRHGVDRHDDHVSMQHAVVLDVGPHRQGCGLLAAVEEHRRARHAHEWRLAVPKAVDELAQRTLGLFPCTRDDFATLLPCRHHRERDDGDEQRQPGAVHELGQIRREEHQIHQQQQAAADRARPIAAIPTGFGRSRRTAWW